MGLFSKNNIENNEYSDNYFLKTGNISIKQLN